MQKLISDLNLKEIIEAESEQNLSQSVNRLSKSIAAVRFKKKQTNSMIHNLDEKMFSNLLNSSMMGNIVVSGESDYSKKLNKQIDKFSGGKNS